ncbi:hypothetical protein B1R94_23410 [Mycolicibacterium litorale]|nr:hypothetical protein B1R94_23410 [Mycolicibacterium litorale]
MGVLPQRTTFSTGDTDVAVAFIRSSVGVQGRIGGLVPHRPMTVSGMTIGRAAVGTAELPSDLEFDTERWPCYVVTHLKSGSVQIGTGARAESCAEGDVVLAVRPGRPCRARTVDAELAFACLAPAALHQITGEPQRDGRAALRFISGRPRSAAAAAQWETAVDYVTATMQGSSGAQDADLVIGAAIRLLAATLLHVFPNTYADAERAERPDPVSSPLLRRAIDYIHANSARDISMADIANAVSVTPRAVQYMFRRQLDTTPMGYLRRIRLERARHDLLAADPTRDTVAAIALRWGFAHTGRFSQIYRGEFGESPSATLRG